MDDTRGYKVRLRLREVLKKRGMSQRELARRIGKSADAVNQMVNNPRVRLQTGLIAELIRVLDVTPNDLIEVVREDLWFGARVAGHLTIHATCVAPIHPSGQTEPNWMDALALSWWDIRAQTEIYRKARELGIEVTLAHHRPSTAGNRDVEETVDKIFETGVHWLIASQLTSELTERVVSKAYGVRPFDPSNHPIMPYLMGWDRRSQPSSFGFGVTDADGRRGRPGVYKGDHLIAERTHVFGGPGQDAGLIVTYRDTGPVGENGFRQDRVIVVLAGHGGPGTEACAKLVVDDGLAPDLYPEDAGQPRMRVAVAEFSRTPRHTPSTFDDRVLDAQHLLDEK